MNFKQKLVDWWNYQPTPQDLHRESFVHLFYGTLLAVFSYLSLSIPSLFFFSILGFVATLVELCLSLECEYKSNKMREIKQIEEYPEKGGLLSPVFEKETT